MSRYCPVVKRKVVYLDCLECEGRECEKKFSKNRQKNDEKNPVKGKIKGKS